MPSTCQPRPGLRRGEKICGQIGQGLLVLLRVVLGDREANARQLAQKIVSLRIFDDRQGKMNLSVGEVGGGVLVVSQFIWPAIAAEGRRPSFEPPRPKLAEQLYEVFAQTVADQGIPVATGRFRAHMMIELVNDGPVTFVVDSK